MSSLKRIYPKEQVVEAQIERKPGRQPVGRGIWESTVYPVDVTVRGVRLALLEKVFDTGVGSPDKVFVKHAQLKRLGVPTIPVMFADCEDGSSMFVTDLTDGGRGVCLSAMDWESDGTRHGIQCGNYQPFRLDNPLEVSGQFADLVLCATLRGVSFDHCDVPFLTIGPDFFGKVILGDLGQVKIESHPRPGLDAKLLEWNIYNGDVCLQRLNKHLDPNSVSRVEFRNAVLRLARQEFNIQGT